MPKTAVMWLPISSEWSAFLGEFAADPESEPAQGHVRVATHAEAIDRCCELLRATGERLPAVVLSSVALALEAVGDRDLALPYVRKLAAERLVQARDYKLGLKVAPKAIGWAVVGQAHGRWVRRVQEVRDGVLVYLVERREEAKR